MPRDADRAVAAFMGGVPPATFHDEGERRLVTVALLEFARWFVAAGEELAPPTAGDLVRLAGWRVATPARPRTGGVSPAGEGRR